MLLRAEQREAKDGAKNLVKSLLLDKGLSWGVRQSDDTQLDWKYDTKQALLSQEGLRAVTELFFEHLEGLEVDGAAGLTLAGRLITASLVHQSAKSLQGYYVRREAKKHGMMKRVEGPSVKGKRLLVVDDTLNEAGFATSAIEALEEEGGIVEGVLVLIDFEKGEHHDLKERGYRVDSIFTQKALGMAPVAEEREAELYRLAWRRARVNKADYSAPLSSPVMHDRKIYVGSDHGKMLCFTEEGRPVWEHETDYHPHGVHATPVIVEGKVIFPTYGSMVYALDGKDGSEVWKTRLSSYNGSSPIYDAKTGLVYLGLENSTKKGTVCAVEAESGRLVWEFTTADHVPCRPALGKELVMAGSNDGFVYGLEKKDGTLRWKYRAGGQVKGRITAVDGECYAASYDGFLYKLREKDGKAIWKRKLGTALYNAPLALDDCVVVGSLSHQLTAVDRKTGQVRWHFMTGGQVLSYPAFRDGLVYAGSHDGCIYAVDADSGKLVWRFITAGKVTGQPLVTENKLYVVSGDGYLYCFERRKAA